jgi:hypothetical protein
MAKQPSLKTVFVRIQDMLAKAPDHRTGQNTTYPIIDALIYVFAVFFFKSPSFNHFHNVYVLKALGNESLLSTISTSKLATPNGVRSILDGMAISLFNDIFMYFYYLTKDIKNENCKYIFRSFNNKNIIALDVNQFFSSYSIKPNFCCTKKHVNKNKVERTEYYKYVLAASLVSIKLKQFLILL